MQGLTYDRITGVQPTDDFDSRYDIDSICGVTVESSTAYQQNGYYLSSLFDYYNDVSFRNNLLLPSYIKKTTFTMIGWGDVTESSKWFFQGIYEEDGKRIRIGIALPLVGILLVLNSVVLLVVGFVKKKSNIYS